MKSLTIKSIRDYQTCARLFDYRYNANELPYEVLNSRDILRTRYEQTIKKVLSFFFYKKQGGIVPSYSALLNRWERLWYPKDMTAYDIMIKQHEVKNKSIVTFSNEAAASLLAFYEFFSGTDMDVFLIDDPFTVPIGKAKLEGNIDLALRDPKTKKYLIINWSLTPKVPVDSSLILDFSVFRYAFEYKSSPHKLDASYFVYDLGSSKPGMREFKVDDEDMTALDFWVNEIMTDDVFVNRRGLTSHCNVCSFDKECSTWKPVRIEKK